MGLMEWAFGGVSTLFGIIGWLLSNKDQKNSEEIAMVRAECEREIEKLYALHHADIQDLYQYKLEVSREHYTQPQIDFRFQQLDTTMKEGFKELSADLKEMTKSLTSHIVGEPRK